MKHLLSTTDLSASDAIKILDTADSMLSILQRENKKLPALRGLTVVNLFYEDSTRTKMSFELAAKRLSADVVNFSAKGSSVSKGESLQDTVQTIASMGADAVIIRHYNSGAAHNLAYSDWHNAAVINAGDGTHQHPTQALLDAFTLRQYFYKNNSLHKDLKGKKIAIVGDIKHSRVARSNINLLKTLGAEVMVLAPQTLLPVSINSWQVQVESSFNSVIKWQPDALMMLRVQKERMLHSYFPQEREYYRFWGLSPERLAKLPSDCAILHPGPMNRGLEISSEAADSSKALILKQVTNGVAIRMAVLYLLLTGDKN